LAELGGGENRSCCCLSSKKGWSSGPRVPLRMMRRQQSVGG
jgi:hypothetical protein